MKRTIGWATQAAALASIFLAIWTPFGSWWQWAATAVVLTLTGAIFLGQPGQHAEGGEIPLRDGEVLSGTGDAKLDEKLNARPKYGRRSE